MLVGILFIAFWGDDMPVGILFSDLWHLCDDDMSVCSLFSSLCGDDIHSFEYQCYGSTAVINIFTDTVRRPTLDVRV